MGKFCMCVFLLLTSLYAVAQKVDSEEAENVATSVLSKNCKPVLNTVSRSSSSDGLKQSTAFYAYNATDGEGFVIVGGDKRLPRILGYSDSGSFDYNNLPPQLSYLLSHLQERVDSMPLVTDKSWNSPRAEIKPEVLLPTAEWGQGAPYNGYCPTINGEKALTGCGATALAILMKYHSFPERGIGEWAYERNGVKASFDYENTPFEWDKMPMKLDETSSEEARRAVGTLMYAAGVSMGVSFGTSDSGTFHSSGEEPNALSFVFRYSPDCQYIYKKHFSDEEFTRLTREQLDNNLPVMYGGAPLDINYGHAWVVDGYTMEGNLFHCNWGWDGYLNGYYALNEMMGRWHCDGMMLNVRPASDEEDPLAPKGCHNNYVDTESTNGVFIDREEVKPHEPFIFTSRGFNRRCKSSIREEDRIVECVALLDKNNKLKEILYFTKTSYIHSSYDFAPYHNCAFRISSIEITILSDNIESTDRIGLMYSYDDIEWEYDRWEQTYYISNPERLKVVKDYLEAPASIPLSGNQPMPLKHVKVNIDDNVIFSKKVNYIGGIKEVEINNGETVSFPKNMNLSFYLKAKVPKEKYTLLGDIDGKLRGAFIPKAGFNCGYSIISENCFSFYPMISVRDEFTFNGKYVPVSELDEITISTPGTLSTLISVDEARVIPRLTIKGNIDARDIWYIAEEFRSLKSLDLRDTEICEVTMTELPWYESYIGNISLHSEAGKLPDASFDEIYRLEELYLPKNTTEIGRNALCTLPQLKELELPESLSYIDDYSIRFDSYASIRSIKSLNPIPPQTGISTFNGVYENHVILYVPDGSVEAYRNAPGWNKFEQILPLSSGIDSPETTESEDAAVIEVFNLQGVRIYSGLKIDMPQLPTGIYIQRDSKGTSKKIAIR